jgi:16S rRNA (guanine527-N7)-methyltransferase
VKRLEQYAALLRTLGVDWGLIGPGEADRIWQRHIDNALAVTEDDSCLPQGVGVLDIGTGAGLPGMVWAIARPDLEVTLVEPMQRRTRFLEHVRDELHVDNVQVVRARAQELDVVAERVTARAVAGTERLLPMLAPLVSEGGRMVLLKGRRAQDEVRAAQGWLRRNRWLAQVRDVGRPPRTRVVVVDRITKG